jgi:hypothetical protein
VKYIWRRHDSLRMTANVGMLSDARVPQGGDEIRIVDVGNKTIFEALTGSATVALDVEPNIRIQRAIS